MPCNSIATVRCAGTSSRRLRFSSSSVPTFLCSISTLTFPSLAAAPSLQKTKPAELRSPLNLLPGWPCAVHRTWTPKNWLPTLLFIKSQVTQYRAFIKSQVTQDRAFIKSQVTHYRWQLNGKYMLPSVKTGAPGEEEKCVLKVFCIKQGLHSPCAWQDTYFWGTMRSRLSGVSFLRDEGIVTVRGINHIDTHSQRAVFAKVFSQHSLTLKPFCSEEIMGISFQGIPVSCYAISTQKFTKICGTGNG